MLHFGMGGWMGAEGNPSSKTTGRWAKVLDSEGREGAGGV